MRVTFIPHGALREHMPARWSCEAATMEEALTGLFVNYPLPQLGPNKPWVVAVPGWDSQGALIMPLSQEETVHVVPEFGGADPATISLSAILTNIAISLAISATLTLVSMLFTQRPQTDTPQTAVTENPEESRYLGPAKNTVKSSTRRPIGYGRDRIGMHFLSFDVEADVAPINGQAPRSNQRRGNRVSQA